MDWIVLKKIQSNEIFMIHRLSPGICSVELKNGTKIDLSRRRAQQLKKLWIDSGLVMQ